MNAPGWLDRHSQKISLAFFLSGFAALIYQIAWQRALFVAFGVDIESVTVTVSIFMFGLGLGGMMGGYLADRYPERIPLIFCSTEALIAMIGIVSVDTITLVGKAASGLPFFAVAIAIFMLLLAPTLLMGSTLPMLVAHAARLRDNVGAATGRLYFINTLGAALGAFATGFLLLYWLDLREATFVAATANLLSALVVGVAMWMGSND
jgi:predicted membrane-bound spermidine synthase